jgi:hypothetical protein
MLSLDTWSSHFFNHVSFGLFCVTMPDLVILPCKEIACIDGLCGAHILFMQYIVCIFTETVEWSFGTGLRKKGHVFVCWAHLSLVAIASCQQAESPCTKSFETSWICRQWRWGAWWICTLVYGSSTLIGQIEVVHVFERVDGRSTCNHCCFSSCIGFGMLVYLLSCEVRTFIFMFWFVGVMCSSTKICPEQNFS